MKKKSFYAILAILALLITSCGGGAKEVIIKNSSKDFVGDLKGYLEVVDGNYTLVKPSMDLILTVKLKAIKQLESGKEFGEIRAELRDENGMPISGASTFVLAKEGWVTTESENSKVDMALKDGQGEFAVQFKYDTYSSGGGSLGATDAIKIASKKAKAFAIVLSKFKEASTSSSSVSSSVSSSTSSTSSDENVTSTKKAGSGNWNSLLDSYEKYINQYIALMKKSKNGDVSAMTEYASMMEKATDFADKLENASDDLSTAQAARFLKLQTKLANAAAGL
jgi:hypothetical protein